MPFNRYTVGAAVTVTGTFTNSLTGATVDPSDANVDVVSPTGAKTTYSYSGGSGAVVRLAVGIYTYDIDTTGLVGRWQYRWWSPPAPGGVQTAGANEFFVNPFPSTTP